MDKVYIFTFGSGQDNAGKYIRLKGSYESTRSKMIERFGNKWSFQYSEDDWNKWIDYSKLLGCPVETELFLEGFSYEND